MGFERDTSNERRAAKGRAFARVGRARPYKVSIKKDTRLQSETSRGRRQARAIAHRAKMAEKDARRMLKKSCDPATVSEIDQYRKLRSETKSQSHFKTFWTFDPKTGSIKERRYMNK